MYLVVIELRLILITVSGPKFWYVVSKLLCVRYLPHQLLNAVNIEYAELMAMHTGKIDYEIVCVLS